MADVKYTTVRAALTTRAISTLGICPAWDRAVCDYLRLQALYLADQEFGPTSRANEEHTRTVYAIEQKYGHNWKAVPEAIAANAVAWKSIREAEDKQSDELLQPMWAAGRVVATTPAPTLNAALYKAELMDWDEVWNDNKLERNGFKIVAEELARFAGGAQ